MDPFLAKPSAAISSPGSSSPPAAAAESTATPAPTAAASAATAPAASTAISTTPAAECQWPQDSTPSPDCSWLVDGQQCLSVSTAGLSTGQSAAGDAHVSGTASIPHRHTHATSYCSVFGGTCSLAAAGPGAVRGSAAGDGGNDTHPEPVAGSTATQARRVAEAHNAAAGRAEDCVRAVASGPIHVPANANGICGRKHGCHGHG